MNDEEKESLLDDVINNSKEEVQIGRHRLRIGWVRNAAKRKVSHILAKEKDEEKVVAKCAAALLLNRRLLIYPLWWMVWRWFYYVEELTEEELLPFISTCKKKADATSYYICMACLIDMKDTEEKKTRKEAGRILQRQK